MPFFGNLDINRERCNHSSYSARCLTRNQERSVQLHPEQTIPNAQPGVSAGGTLVPTHWARACALRCLWACLCPLGKAIGFFNCILVPWLCLCLALLGHTPLLVLSLACGLGPSFGNLYLFGFFLCILVPWLCLRLALLVLSLALALALLVPWRWVAVGRRTLED